MIDQDFVVNRWKRYGKDRLYVRTLDEAKVGFWDLLSGEAHPESPEHLPALLAAVDDWKTEQNTDGAGVRIVAAAPAASPPQPTATPQTEPVVAAVAAPVSSALTSTNEQGVRPWLDLATNQPGAEAREQAQTARDAAPFKTLLARVLGVHTDERAWRIGADGEEKVAAQLAKLAKKDPRWRSLHAIPVGDRGTDIDHLLIGPGGIFTINTKNHPGSKIWVGGNTFIVNGHSRPYVRNSRHEAERAARLLTAVCGFPVHVQGLIVTVNASDVTIKAQPDGVDVTRRNNLVGWLLRHGGIHAIDTFDVIYAAARRSTTWQP